MILRSLLVRLHQRRIRKYKTKRWNVSCQKIYLLQYIKITTIAISRQNSTHIKMNIAISSMYRFPVDNDQ